MGLNPGASHSPGGWSGSGLGSRSTPTTLAEINVTPLVDVMLVLLIVFMISAPMMQEGIEVNLPKAGAPSLTGTPEQLILGIRSTREVFIGETQVPISNLMNKLTSLVASKPEVEILIHADQSLPYGYIAQVMADVKKAGIQRIGLVTQPVEK